MKLVKYCWIAGWFLFSCQKELATINTPDFDVEQTELTVKAGKTVEFKFKGTAANLSFYSGEIYNDYLFREGRKVDVAGKGLTLSFSTAMASGTPPGTQKDQFSILVSSDFNGAYNSLENVKKATWKDITGLFPIATGTTVIQTPPLDMKDYLVPGKPLYIAFKYVNRSQVENGYSQQWIVENILFKSITAKINDGLVTIANQAHAGFQIVDQDPKNAKSRSAITATRVTLYGPAYKNPADPMYDPKNPIYDPKNPIYDPKAKEYVPGLKIPEFIPYDPASPYNDPSVESWAVSAPIKLDAVDLGVDRPVSIKSSIYGANPQSYSYSYPKPGRYEAHFVALNHSVEKKAEVVRKVIVNVEP